MPQTLNKILIILTIKPLSKYKLFGLLGKNKNSLKDSKFKKTRAATKAKQIPTMNTYTYKGVDKKGNKILTTVYFRKNRTLDVTLNRQLRNDGSL